MAIWSVEIKELEKLYESLKGQLPDLEKEVGKLIKADDENMILLYSRRCLEVIITDLCECELKRPRKTEPLKGIIDKLLKEGKVPAYIITSMHGLNELSTYGAHPKDFDLEQVKPVLINLDIIIKWYFEYKETGTGIKAKATEEIRQEIKSDEDVRKSITISRKRLAGILGGLIGIIASVFAVLYFSKIIGDSKQTNELEKYIAVLPFKLLSDEPDKQYLADGMRDAITLHLSKIKGLHVIGISVEQYRNPSKTTTAIGRELDVEFLLEASFQKFGDDVKLIVQLIKTGKEGLIWANNYDRNWSDIFAVQSEVAQAVASELYASITPEEKKLIERIPTANLTAYDFYQRGKEEHTKYWIDNNNKEALERADDLYHEAIRNDSTFALAYTGLAWVYWDKHFWETYFTEKFLDSVPLLANIALLYDGQLSEAYTLKGSYFNKTGDKEQAIKELNKAIKFNPNDWMAYYKAGLIYNNYDWVKSIEDLHKAKSLYHGSQLPGILRDLGAAYHQVGFYEKAKYYIEEAFKLDKDSLTNYYSLGYLEHQLGNFAKFIESVEKINAIDSNYLGVQTYRDLGEEYMFLQQSDKSLNCFKKWLQKKSKTLTDQDFFGLHRVGWAYLKEGDKKVAEHYFNELIKYCEKIKKLGRVSIDPLRPAYDLAGAYAMMGDRNKAIENLKMWAKMKVCPLWWLTYLKYDPLFDTIRNDTEFQQILRNMEAKYQAEHERVRKWLEE